MQARGLLRHLFCEKDQQNGHFFIPWSGCDRLVVNLVDNDQGLHDTVIRVSDPWEDASAKNRGVISTSWNRGSISKGVCPEEGAETIPDRQRSCNWSWLLDSNRPSIPIVILRPLVLARDDAESASIVAPVGEEGGTGSSGILSKGV